MQPEEKLYVLVDERLPTGLQMAQVAHACFDLSLKYPLTIARWHDVSNFVVILGSSDLPFDSGVVLGTDSTIVASFVVEPDLPHCPLTAVAFCPHPAVGPALAGFPLAGEQVHDRRLFVGGPCDGQRLPNQNTTPDGIIYFAHVENDVITHHGYQREGDHFAYIGVLDW